MAIYNKNMKYCKHCGREILKDAVVCPKCGLQVEELKVEYVPKNVYTNNYNYNTNLKKKNKWIAFLLCLFLGMFGGHCFYDNKSGKGILYIFTVGLFGFGIVIDLIAILFRKTNYYV